jgi:TetR/AcrR family transcriptional repressor of nem operon
MGRVSNAKQKLMSAARNLIWQHSFSATTVDAICLVAGVKKGSFYYFFDSKSQLAVEALEADWRAHKPRFEEIFSGPPLDRLKNFFDSIRQSQESIFIRQGHVLGCPIFALGCEVSVIDETICLKVREILAAYESRIETAIRDAQTQGLIAVQDPRATAQRVFAYIEGALTLARIQNSVEPLNDLCSSAMGIIQSPILPAAKAA